MACAGHLIERAGDGLLVLFESSTAAVRCALAVQRAVERHQKTDEQDSRLRLRAGVNVGDIIIDGVEIAGDDVNIAVRLQSVATPGTVLISAAVRDQLHEDLGATFIDLGKLSLKNIGRPIHAFQLDPDPIALSWWRRWLGTLRRALSLPWLVGGAMAALAIAGIAVYPRFAARPSIDLPPMSVAVAPFEANAPPDARAAAEISDVVTRGLASTTWLQVAAPDVSSQLSGKTNNLTVGGRAIRVRYVVAAKIDSRDGALGVDVNLIDTSKGVSAWTTRVEAKQAAGAAAAVANDIVILLRESIYEAESRRLLESGASPRTAMEFKMLGDLVTDTHFLVLDSERKARKHYESALRLDPNFVPAMVSIGYTLLSELDLDPAVDHAQIIDRLDSISKHAVSRDPSSAPAWQFRAESLARQWRWEAALDASSKALALDPARAFGYGERASLLVLLGRPTEALPEVEKALSLAEQRFGYALFQKCRAEMALGLYKAAIDSCQKSVSREEWWMQHAYLLAAYALIDDGRNRSIEQATLARIHPGLSIARFKALRLSNVPDFERQMEEHLYRGLRNAGMPENN